jgi:hypothetical protein
MSARAGDAAMLAHSAASARGTAGDRGAAVIP